jgi:putative flippase GtrA
VIAFAAGAVNGYALNRRWTFHAAGSNRGRVTYVAVQALGLAMTAGLLWALVDVGSVGRVVAQALSIPPVTLTTFVLNRQVTFRSGAL